MYSPLSQFLRFNVSSSLRLLRNSRKALLCTLAALVVLPTAKAVNPPPDGGYPGNTTAEGNLALNSLTSGTSNTALGYKTLFSDTTGYNNTATGSGALRDNQDGWDNTATGVNALFHNTGGIQNAAFGFAALQNNTNGNFNTAVGLTALSGNQTGDGNTAVGWAALANSTGNSNTAVGLGGLTSNKGGGSNTAVGEVALQSNVSGSFNTAAGAKALNDNVTGFFNTACGYQALQNNTGGNFNIALGVSAGANLVAGGSNIYIGNSGVAREDQTIRIGTNQTQTFVAGISGVAVTGPAVHVNGSGQLGIVPSSERFKVAIKPMDKSSEAILNLKPVSFHYKQDLDPDKIAQFGLIAEEVEKVNPDLVVHDENGKPYTVRYEAVNAMLLNEFLKAHRKLQEQQTTIERQQKQIEALTAGLQKVTARVEAANSFPRVVSDN
jgi:hypothetical protein